MGHDNERARVETSGVSNQPGAQVLKLRILEHRRCGNKSAQGNALGVGQIRAPVALKGQNKVSATCLVSPFQGFAPCSPCLPRALPWADLLPHLRC